MVAINAFLQDSVRNAQWKAIKAVQKTLLQAETVILPRSVGISWKLTINVLTIFFHLKIFLALKHRQWTTTFPLFRKVSVISTDVWYQKYLFWFNILLTLLAYRNIVFLPTCFSFVPRYDLRKGSFLECFWMFPQTACFHSKRLPKE